MLLREILRMAFGSLGVNKLRSILTMAGITIGVFTVVTVMTAVSALRGSIETGLSFLGLGLHAPSVSWGLLLQEAQNVRTVSLASWLLLPGLAVVITVLAFNFLGDGLRDAADPYH